VCLYACDFFFFLLENWTFKSCNMETRNHMFPFFPVFAVCVCVCFK
jgi:hypothetical protein